MAKKIYKTELRVIVFSEEPLDFNFVSLEDLAASIHTGDNIGDVTIVSRSEITDPGVVRDELLAIGNDGEFFQHDEDDSPTGWEEG